VARSTARPGRSIARERPEAKANDLVLDEAGFHGWKRRQTFSVRFHSLFRIDLWMSFNRAPEAIELKSGSMPAMTSLDRWKANKRNNKNNRVATKGEKNESNVTTVTLPGRCGRSGKRQTSGAGCKAARALSV
jgi:hypothetical protein